MSILCSSDVYGRLELLIHEIRQGSTGKSEAVEKLMEIIESAEDGDMLSAAISSVLNI